MSGTYPTSPQFNAVNFINEDPTSTSQAHSGKIHARKRSGQRWKFTVKYPQLTDTQSRAVEAFIDAQRGGFESFTIVLPKISTSKGAGGGSPQVVAGSPEPSGMTLDIDGCPTSTTGWRKAGDIFTIAGDTKVYRLTADADTDGSGAVTLSFIPPLVVTPSDNAALTFDSVAFTVRLDGSIQTYPLSLPNLVKIEVDMIEDI